MTRPAVLETATVRPEVLQRELARHLERPGRIVRLDRRRSRYATSHHLEQIHVVLEDGVELELMCKHLGRGGLLPSARGAKPSFLEDSRREPTVYRSLLAPAGLGPRWYGEATDPEAGGSCLLLEKVGGIELYQVGELATWQRVASWLAGMHERLRIAVSSAEPDLACLVRYDAAFYRRWMRRARATFADEPSAARQVGWLAARYEPAVEHLVTRPATVVHGEFYASNVLVHQHDATPRVWPVDWEMAAVGPALVDLAALVAGDWTPGQRRAIALAYREALPEADRPPVDRFLTDLEYCRLHLSVQWLGWSPGWTAPAGHTRDWLRDAMDAAERLGV